jgi:hypothetical protein
MKEISTKPSLRIGKGINFIYGSDSDRKKVNDLIVKNEQAIFKWTEKYGLFFNHCASIETEGSPNYVKPFRDENNKMRSDARYPERIY